MRRMMLVLAVAVALGACSQDKAAQMEANAAAGAAGYGGEMMAREEAAMDAAAPAPALETATAPVVDADRAQQGAPTPQGPSPVLFLAYSYQMGMQLPAQRLGAVMDAHVRACQEAGPRLCQLISANRSGDPESYLSGYVSLRGEPAWLRAFMTSVAQQTDAAGGRVVSQATSTEDLTRAIVDTEAQMRAKTTLRDRLQRLLDQRPGKLSDLLEVERELARVQADLDATQSNLAVMRTRVAMSELNLSYESAPQSLRADTFEPLKNSLAGFVGNVVGGVAAIITVIAVLLPWAGLAALLGWLLLAWRKRRGGRFFKRKKAPELPPET